MILNILFLNQDKWIGMLFTIIWIESLNFNIIKKLNYGELGNLNYDIKKILNYDELKKLIYDIRIRKF